MSFERIGAFFCLVLVVENKTLKEKVSKRNGYHWRITKYVYVVRYKACKSHFGKVTPVSMVGTRGQVVY
jgi:hypothetical protein